MIYSAENQTAFGQMALGQTEFGQKPFDFLTSCSDLIPRDSCFPRVFTVLLSRLFWNTWRISLSIISFECCIIRSGPSYNIFLPWSRNRLFFSMNQVSNSAFQDQAWCAPNNNYQFKKNTQPTIGFWITVACQHWETKRLWITLSWVLVEGHTNVRAIYLWYGVISRQFKQYHQNQFMTNRLISDLDTLELSNLEFQN